MAVAPLAVGVPAWALVPVLVISYLWGLCSSSALRVWVCSSPARVLSALFQLLLATLAARQCSRGAHAFLIVHVDGQNRSVRTITRTVLGVAACIAQVILHVTMVLADTPGAGEQRLASRNALRFTAALVACTALQANSVSHKWTFLAHCLATVLQQEHQGMFTQQLMLLAAYWPLELVLHGSSSTSMACLGSAVEPCTSSGCPTGASLNALADVSINCLEEDRAHDHMATALFYFVAVHCFLAVQACFITISFRNPQMMESTREPRWISLGSTGLSHVLFTAKGWLRYSGGVGCEAPSLPDPLLPPREHQEPCQLDGQRPFEASTPAPVRSLSRPGPPEGRAAPPPAGFPSGSGLPADQHTGGAAGSRWRLKQVPAGRSPYSGPTSSASGSTVPCRCQLWLLRRGLTCGLACGVAASYAIDLGLKANSLGLRAWLSPAILCLAAMVIANALMSVLALALSGRPLTLRWSGGVVAMALLTRIQTMLLLAWPIVLTLAEPVELSAAYAYHIYGFVACSAVIGLEPFAHASAFQLAAAFLGRAVHAHAATATQLAGLSDAALARQQAHGLWWRTLAVTVDPRQLPEYFLGAAAMLALRWALGACLDGDPQAVADYDGSQTWHAPCAVQQQGQHQRDARAGAPEPDSAETTLKPAGVAQILMEHASPPNTSQSPRRGSGGGASPTPTRRAGSIARSISFSLRGPFGSYALAAALSPLTERAADAPRGGRAGTPGPTRLLSCRQSTTSIISEQIEVLLDIKRKGRAAVSCVGIEPSASLGPPHRPPHQHSQRYRRLQRRDSAASVDNGGLSHFHLQQGHAAPPGPSRLAARHVGSEVEAETTTTDDSDASEQHDAKLLLTSKMQPLAEKGRSLRALRRLSSLPSRLRHVAPPPVADDRSVGGTASEERQQSRLATKAGEQPVGSAGGAWVSPRSQSLGSGNIFASAYSSSQPPTLPLAADVSSWQHGAPGTSSGSEGESNAGLTRRRTGGEIEATAQVKSSALGMALGARLAASSASGGAGESLRKEALRQMVMARWRASLGVEAVVTSAAASHALIGAGSEEPPASLSTLPPIPPSSHVSVSPGGSVYDGDGLEHQAVTSLAAAASQWPNLPPVTAAAAAALAAIAATADEVRSHSPRPSLGGFTGTGSGPHTGTASALTGNSRRSLGMSSRNTSIKTSLLSPDCSEHEMRSRGSRGNVPALMLLTGAAEVNAVAVTDGWLWRWWPAGPWLGNALEAAWQGETGALLLHSIAIICAAQAMFQQQEGADRIRLPPHIGKGQKRSAPGPVWGAASALLVLAELLACIAHLVCLRLAPSTVARCGAWPWAARLVAAPPLQRLGFAALGLPAASSPAHAAWRVAYSMACVRMSAAFYGRAVLTSTAAVAAVVLIEQHLTGAVPAGATAAVVGALRHATQLLCASSAGAAMGLLAAHVLPAVAAGALTSPGLHSRLAPEGAVRAGWLGAFVRADSEALATGASVLYLMAGQAPLLYCTRLARSVLLHLFGASSSRRGPEGSAAGYMTRPRLWWLQLLLHSIPMPTWARLLRPPPAVAAIAGLFVLLLLLVSVQSLLLALLTGDSRRSARLRRRQAALASLKGQLLQAQSVMELLHTLMDGAGEVLAGGSAWCVIVPSDSLDSQQGACGVLVEVHLEPGVRPWPGQAVRRSTAGQEHANGSTPSNAVAAKGGDAGGSRIQAEVDWSSAPQHGHAPQDDAPAGARACSGSDTDAETAIRAPAVHLAEYPSLQLAIAHRTVWLVQGATARVYGGCTRSCDTVLLTQPTPPDLARLTEVVGASGLLVVPLECLAQPYGVLVVACAQPASVDRDLRQLSVGLADGVSQALYLKQMQADMAASEVLMQDIYPSHAVQALKRRAHTQGAGSGAGPLAPLSLTTAGSHPALGILGEAAPLSPLVERSAFCTTGSFTQRVSSGASIPCEAGVYGSSPLGKQAIAAAAVAAVRRASKELCSGGGGTLRLKPFAARQQDATPAMAAIGVDEGAAADGGAFAQSQAHPQNASAASGPSAAAGAGMFALESSTASPFDAVAAQALSPAAAAVASVLLPGLRVRTSLPGCGSRPGPPKLSSLPNTGSRADGRVPSERGAEPSGPAATGLARPCSLEIALFCDVPYARWHPAVTVLFADICGYTATSQALQPEQVMALLHCLFCKYDALLGNHRVYKVETIGDCYMAATGLMVETPTHALDMVCFGRAMIAAAAEVTNPVSGEPLQIRVGINSGRVMSGIVGHCRARYCLFGDVVNTASRMESTGVPGKVQISEETYALLPEDEQGSWVCRGFTECKGKGLIRTYLG